LPQDDTGVVLLAPPPETLNILADRGGTIIPHFEQPDDETVSMVLDLGDGQLLPLLRPMSHDTGTPLLALVPLGVEGFDRIEAIIRLLAFLHGRAIPQDTRLTLQQRARLRRMLQTFDGYRDGATQQEIAQVIFHIGHLTRDEWQASSMRHAVKSLLRDARAMIAGDYRKLLRHRRST